MATPHYGLGFPDFLEENGNVESPTHINLIDHCSTRRRPSTKKKKSKRRSRRCKSAPRSEMSHFDLESPKSTNWEKSRSSSRNSQLTSNKEKRQNLQIRYKSPDSPETARTSTSTAGSSSSLILRIKKSRDEDDDLLDELLEHSVVEKQCNKIGKSSRKPKFVVAQNNVEHDEHSSLSDEESAADSVATKDLLKRASERLVNQDLMNEIKELKESLERKDNEIEQMAGQLRMAVATKCDLIIAHTELERHHEMDLQLQEMTVKEMKTTNNTLVEMRAEIEKEFMNELSSLSNQLVVIKGKHRKELMRKERQLEQQHAKHVDEMIEKESHIAQLEEEIMCLEGNFKHDRSDRNGMAGFSARRPSPGKARKYRIKTTTQL